MGGRRGREKPRVVLAEKGSMLRRWENWWLTPMIFADFTYPESFLRLALLNVWGMMDRIRYCRALRCAGLMVQVDKRIEGTLRTPVLLLQP